MYLLGDFVQNIAIISLMLTIYRLKKFVKAQNEIVHILCKWQFEKKNLL